MNETSKGILSPDSNESHLPPHILTADEAEAILNYVDPEPIKTAISALYRRDDIIEVRAWDKQHNVYTGRYTRSKKLMEHIKLWNEECDVYYVLNPVGNKHGLRDFSRGGLCTWEQDVPWRRYFLLDFDPKRDSKIATHGQWLAAFDAACRAKEWLDNNYGFKGNILASSGNGCHLLVPCQLPNDSEGKEIVRKVQRIVSEKFSTAEVECECFPDANRLVRAYGSYNRKGTPTEDLPHRKSEILFAPAGVDDDPKSLLLAVIKDNPIPDSKTANHHGGGAGPFSRDQLYARLEAWAENYRGDDGEEFAFEETDRKDGFRVMCPGNMPCGWPDGEQHETVGESLNDSTIVYVENGWPRFSCRHNHCGEGAEHGKKTWKDLQEYYDKERKFHRILDENDYAATWLLDYVDDGAEDKGTANVDALLEEGITEPRIGLCPTIEEEEDPLVRAMRNRGRPKDEWTDMPMGEKPLVTGMKPEAVVADAPAPSAAGGSKKLYEMPETCMHGWLGDCARELETPLGFAYPAVLTAWAAQIQTFSKHVRPTLYTALVGPIHCGKSETIKRAVEYIHLFDPDTVSWTVPGSDRGLIKQFGLGKKDDEKAIAPTVKTKLLAQDELRNTLSKANIQNSSLPSTLCTLWSSDEAGASDKTGVHEALVRLNILGALKADDGDDFAEVFGKGSTSGLYDRFVYGLAPKGWKYKKWEREPVRRAPKGCAIPAHCYVMMNEWRDIDPVGRGRLAEIALRIAYISSSANHDDEITVEAMTAALEFCRWQEVIRINYKAGLGDGADALCTSAILNVLEKLEPGVWIRWKETASKKNWYRKYGSRTLASCRDALFRSGITVEETVEEDDGKPKRTGRLRLRWDGDEVNAKLEK